MAGKSTTKMKEIREISKARDLLRKAKQNKANRFEESELIMQELGALENRLTLKQTKATDEYVQLTERKQTK